MDHRLLQGRNLLEQVYLKGGGPHTTTCPEPVDIFVVGDGGSEAAIENHHHRLSHHLHEAYAAIVTSPFWYQDHPLPGRLLRELSFPECRLYQLHHHLPFHLPSPLLPSLYPGLEGGGGGVRGRPIKLNF